MTIRFRYFPYLVQQMVMHHMDFLDVFSLYAVSRKSQALAKSYFNRLECKLHYDMDKVISIRRNSSPENYCSLKDRLEIKPMMQKRKRVLNFCTSRFSKQFQIPVKNSGDMQDGVLRFAQELFPKIDFSLSFDSLTRNDFWRMMNLAKNLNVPIEEVDIYHAKINNSQMKEILTECSDVKKLRISGSCPRFQYDSQTNPPFKFDSFQLFGAAEWVTKDHLVNLFMGCREVYLSTTWATPYNDQELVEICKKWLEAPETQCLDIAGAKNFSLELPGAVEIRVLVFKHNYLDFDQKKCYKVEKADGTPAVIFHDEVSHIVLTTEFEYAVAEGDEIPEGLLEHLG